MENASLALIEELIKRARKNDEFYDFLKKVSNLSNEDIHKMMSNQEPNYRGKDNVLRLLSYPRLPELKALNGGEFVAGGDSAKIATLMNIYGFKTLNLHDLEGIKKVVPTKRMLARVDETYVRTTRMTVFSSLPGNWNEKCFTFNQVLAYLYEYSSWINKNGLTMFLVRKNPEQGIEEKCPQENIIAVNLYSNSSNFSLSFDSLDSPTVFPGHRYIVSPLNFKSYLEEDSKRLVR